MKSSLISVLGMLLLAILFSTWGYAQTTWPQTESNLPKVIQQLKQAIQNADRSQQDKYSQLRLERALFYYQHALRYHQAKWSAKAKDYAQRGLLLVELHQQAVGKPGFYRADKPQAQTAGISSQ
ncbi:hypothetical protein [Paraglaciecola aestuariivivens]